MSDLLHKRSGIASVGMNVDEREDPNRTVILAVGEISLWQTAGRLLQATSDLAYSEFSSLSPELLQTLAPDVVVSPLVTRSFDCLDLAQMLQASEYYGRYRIIAPNMPNPRLILSEIAVLCPGLDTDVIVIDNHTAPGVH